MGAPIEETNTMARNNRREVRLHNQPHMIVTKKAPITIPANR
jgi:hypothetical protein